MTPPLEANDLAFLSDLLRRVDGNQSLAPAPVGQEFVRRCAALLESSLELELRGLCLVGNLLEAQVPELAVYGAARAGREIARLAQAAGIRVAHFVESRTAFGPERVDGIPVLGPAAALDSGVHAYALGTLERGAELRRVLEDAYRDKAEAGLRVFPLPALGSPAPAAVATAAARHERLLAVVRERQAGLYGALLEELPREAPAPRPAAPGPVAAPFSWSEEPLDPRLLEPAKPLWSANLQFTGDCNLKCTYCGHANSGWSGIHMDDALVGQLVDFILADRCRRVMIGFFGEATLFQGWERICARLLDAGIELATNSNFLRPLRPEEVDVFSRFTEVAMSIDTVDPELQKRLRPPMDVRNLVHSLHRIRGRALEQGREGPHFIWTGVLTPQVVELLPELFSYAKSCGITHLNLNDVTPVEESASMDNLFDLDDAAFVAMAGQLQAAAALAARLDLRLTAPLERIGARLERSRRRLRGEACPEPPQARIPTFQGTAVFPFERIPEGKVGLCFAPWVSASVMPTGEVFPCCFQREAMGRIGPGQGLADILDNEAYRAFRAALLTGRNLNETCRNCILVQRVVDPEEARAEVAGMLGLAPNRPV
jgi:MoaA/NifB/PqqE/SkfB family radical SAM enzyme